jgi:predicted nucleic acid-binding protein
VRLLFADEQTTHHYAGVFTYLRGEERPIPTNDLWIAALAIQHDLVLLTLDAHYSKIPQLVLAS